MPTEEQWKVIEKEVEADEGSIREIAKAHGLNESSIRRRFHDRKLAARKVAHERQVRISEAAQVKIDRAVTEGLRAAGVSDEKKVVETLGTVVAELAADAEEETVQAVSTAIAGITTQHRGQAQKAVQLVEGLIHDLSWYARNRQHLMDEIWTATSGDEDTPFNQHRRRKAMEAAIDLPAHAKAAQQLVTALDRAHFIVRQSWGMATGVKDQTPDPVENADELVADIKRLADGWTAPP